MAGGFGSGETASGTGSAGRPAAEGATAAGSGSGGRLDVGSGLGGGAWRLGVDKLAEEAPEFPLAADADMRKKRKPLFRHSPGLLFALAQQQEPAVHRSHEYRHPSDALQAFQCGKLHGRIVGGLADDQHFVQGRLIVGVLAQHLPDGDEGIRIIAHLPEPDRLVQKKPPLAALNREALARLRLLQLRLAFGFFLFALGWRHDPSGILNRLLISCRLIAYFP